MTWCYPWEHQWSLWSQSPVYYSSYAEQDRWDRFHTFHIQCWVRDRVCIHCRKVQRREHWERTEAPMGQCWDSDNEWWYRKRGQLHNWLTDHAISAVILIGLLVIGLFTDFGGIVNFIKRAASNIKGGSMEFLEFTFRSVWHFLGVLIIFHTLIKLVQSFKERK